MGRRAGTAQFKNAGRLILTAGWLSIAPFAFALNCEKAGDANYIIDARMELAMDLVRVNNLQAPEAARLYALTSQTLERAYDDTGNPAVMAQAALTLLQLEYPQTGPHLNKFKKHGPCPVTSAQDIRRGWKIGKTIYKSAPKPARENRGAPQGETGPVLINWAQTKPFILKSAKQFRPEGPPALDSAQFSLAFAAVKDLGARGSRTRTTDQSAIARFWADGDYTATGAGHWNAIALDVTKDSPVSERVQTLRLMNTAMNDAGIAAWDAKYYWRYWRPEVAVRQVAPAWTPYLETPRHPEYVSAHSALSGAAAYVLTRRLGVQAFCTTSEGLKGARRCYADFQDAAQEAGMSRIYGGIHFPFSNRDGLKLGRDVADYSVRNSQSAK